MLLLPLTFSFFYITGKSSEITKRQHLIVLFASVTGTSLLHYFANSQPWAPVYNHNDVGHALSVAAEISRFEIPFIPFTPRYWGRVALSMDYAAIWMMLFGTKYQILWTAFLQTATAYLASVLSLKLTNTEAVRSIILLPLLFSAIIPLSWMTPIYLDMYSTAATWMLLAILPFTIKKPSALLCFCSGLLFTSGWMIAPSVKIIAFILPMLFIYKNRSSIRSMQSHVAGAIGPSMALLGSFALYGKNLFMRELWLAKSNHVDAYMNVLNEGIISATVKFYEYFFIGTGFYHFFPDITPIFYWPTFMAILGLLLVNNKLIKKVIFLVIVITFAQMLATSPMDYRLSHAMPFWAIGFVIIYLKAKKIYSYILVAVIGLSFLFQTKELLNANYRIQPSWYCQDQLWTSSQNIPENLSYIVFENGNCEYALGKNSSTLQSSIFWYDFVKLQPLRKVHTMNQLIHNRNAIYFVMPEHFQNEMARHFSGKFNFEVTDRISSLNDKRLTASIVRISLN